MDLATKRKTELETIHVRLLNWGKWLRYDDTLAKLGYPTQAPFVFSPRKGGTIADPDAEHMEFVVSSLMVSGFGDGELFAFILKVEYAERPEHMLGPVVVRARDVSRRFRRPCSERSYYRHLTRAKIAVHHLAGPVKR